MKAKENNLNLRSEKVRDIVGEIPPAIMRYGLYIIMLFIFLIFFCLSIIPAYEQYTTDITIKSIPEKEVVISPIYGKINYLVDDNIYINKNELIGRIINDDSIYTIYSRTSGIIVMIQKDKTIINKEDIVCNILPKYILELYGEIFIPIKYINENYRSFDVEITSQIGHIIKGKITHIYKIPILKENEQFYKANISVDDDDISLINMNCKINIIIKKDRMINWIFN
ncbi:MAG: hypothetical protein LBH58_01085 [Tannerellaceae bacterium]|jgi:hypothetical protein|nr:hypothetical protein [Tannerellaceae bacterium]